MQCVPLSHSVQKNPIIFWKYEGETLCWLFEKEVFALAKFHRKGLVSAAMYFVSYAVLLGLFHKK